MKWRHTHCYKYISDSDADGEDQGEQWRENVSKGADLFRNTVLTKEPKSKQLELL